MVLILRAGLMVAMLTLRLLESGLLLVVLGKVVV